MHCLLYSSDALYPYGADELESILTCARANNARDGITGVLLYARSMVMQYIEGPREKVEAAFARIKSDPRHHNVQVLASAEVRERRFPHWKMAFDHLGHVLDVPGTVDLSEVDPTGGDPADGRFDSVTVTLRNFREGVALMAA